MTGGPGGTADRRSPAGPRLLAARLDNIGDVVMLGPALRELRRHHPDAHLTLWCTPAGSTVAPMLPWIDDVLVTRPVWQDAHGALPLDPGRELELVDRLAAGHHDRAWLFTSFGQSPHPPAYACYLAGIPERIGESKEFGGGLLTSSVPPADDGLHQTERNLRLLEHGGVPVRDDRLELRIPPVDADWAVHLLRAAGIPPDGPFAVIAPGASAAARRYPAERFGRTARLLAMRLGLRSVIVGGDRDRAAADVALAAADHPAVRSLVGATTLPQLTEVVRRSSLVVTNNSAPLHLADAFGVPSVVAYSGTDLVTQWEARHSPTRNLAVPVGCSPCYRFDCPVGGACLDRAPEELLSAAAELLGADPLPLLGPRPLLVDERPVGEHPRATAGATPDRAADAVAGSPAPTRR